eukprot:TRINITY_DN1855_c0_g1_i2.p2 TRINITY_DN1855_c0_g1~~TRINITY_DN1855_c0_g1_i2.p2  ORF type:complete len:225 (-),score=75.32 TRINITY_DN1855_c0_g1_i2:1323-1997(-)
MKFQLDKTKLLESTDTTTEDFQAIYTSIYELIMEPIKKKQQQQQEAEEDQKTADAVAEDAAIDEGPPAKRRKIAPAVADADDDMGADADFTIQKKPSKPKAPKTSAPVEQPLPRSVINEALNQETLLKFDAEDTEFGAELLKQESLLATAVPTASVIDASNPGGEDPLKSMPVPALAKEKKKQEAAAFEEWKKSVLQQPKPKVPVNAKQTTLSFGAKKSESKDA